MPICVALCLIILMHVYEPGCVSFRFNPFAWRGVCFGRTCAECAYFGCYKGRWARTVHALNLGREYTDPFDGFSRKGHETADEVLCLCEPSCTPSPCHSRRPLLLSGCHCCWCFAMPRSPFSPVKANDVGDSRPDGNLASLAGCFDQCLAVVLSLGVGQFLSVLGNCGINCSACYSCHSREKFRR